MKQFLSDSVNWLVLLVMVTLIIVFGYLVYLIFTPQAQRDFDQRNAFMQICTQSETYTRDECIRLAGKLE